MQTSAKREKKCNRCQAWENMQPVLNAGKNVKLMPNMRRVTSTGKHESVPSAGKLITSAKQGKTVGCGFAPEVVNQTE